MKKLLLLFILICNPAFADSLIIPPSLVGVAPIGQIPGTTTNDDGATGKVGEIVSCSVVSGSAITLTFSQVSNLCTVSLTAGDWDVRTNFTFVGGGTVSTISQVIGTISNTGGVLETTLPGRGVTSWVGGQGGFDLGASQVGVSVSPVRISLASTTTIYFTARALGSGNAAKLYGIGSARRAR